MIFNIKFSSMILRLYIEIKLQRYFLGNCRSRSLAILFLSEWLLSILVSVALCPLQGRSQRNWCLRNHLWSILRIYLLEAIDINNHKLPIPMILLGLEIHLLDESLFSLEDIHPGDWLIVNHYRRRFITQASYLELLEQYLSVESRCMILAIKTFMVKWKHWGR